MRPYLTQAEPKELNSQIRVTGLHLVLSLAILLQIENTDLESTEKTGRQPTRLPPPLNTALTFDSSIPNSSVYYLHCIYKFNNLLLTLHHAHCLVQNIND